MSHPVRPPAPDRPSSLSRDGPALVDALILFSSVLIVEGMRSRSREFDVGGVGRPCLIAVRGRGLGRAVDGPGDAVSIHLPGSGRYAARGMMGALYVRMDKGRKIERYLHHLKSPRVPRVIRHVTAFDTRDKEVRRVSARLSDTHVRFSGSRLRSTPPRPPGDPAFGLTAAYEYSSSGPIPFVSACILRPLSTIIKDRQDGYRPPLPPLSASRTARRSCSSLRLLPRQGVLYQRYPFRRRRTTSAVGSRCSARHHPDRVSRHSRQGQKR